uniref:Uncharacterized protein n=1 Tax=Rhizophora mucronata TaxID=61149 RepID=A0A2P2IZ70_RHIMU
MAMRGFWYMSTCHRVHWLSICLNGVIKDILLLLGSRGLPLCWMWPEESNICTA